MGAVVGAAVVQEQQRGAAEWELLWEHARGLWASVLVARAGERRAGEYTLREQLASVGSHAGACRREGWRRPFFYIPSFLRERRAIA